MNSNQVKVCCRHCGARIRCPATLTRFKCPRCLSTSELGSAESSHSPGGTIAQRESAPPVIEAAIEKVVTLPTAEVRHRTDSMGTVNTWTAPAPLHAMLSNGLVVGLLTATALYISLSEFGWSNRLLMLIAAVSVVAGYLGVLHRLYRAMCVLLVRAYDSAAIDRGNKPGPGREAAPESQMTFPESAAQGTMRKTAPERQRPIRSETVNQVSRPLAVAPSAPTHHRLPDPAPRERKVHSWLVGVMFAVVLSVVFSMLKPVLGMQGLMIALCAVAALVIVWVATCYVIAVAAVSPLSRDRLAGWTFKARGRWALRAGVVTLALFACFVGAESSAPPEGIARSLGVRAKESMVQVRQDPDVSDDTVWSGASLVLVNPGHVAVAMRVDDTEGTPEYVVLAKAVDEAARRAMKIAWEMHIPVIGNDPALTRRLHGSVELRSKVDALLARELRMLLRPRTYLPTDGTLVSFLDNRDSRTHVGYQLQNTAESFEFSELLPSVSDGRGQKDPAQRLIPFQTRLVSRQRDVRPGSERMNLDEAGVRQSVDFLDWCLYKVLAKLQSRHVPGLLHVDSVYVEKVRADIHDEEIGLQAMKAAYSQLRSRQDVDLADVGPPLSSPAALLDIMMRRVVDAERELDRRITKDEQRQQLQEELKQLAPQIGRMRSLIDQQNRLSSDIRARLVRAGVALVADRQDYATTSKVTGKSWVRPEFGHPDFDKLVTASHLLITEIRTPELSGRYQMSMRLIDVITGEIIYEDQGERPGTAVIMQAEKVSTKPNAQEQQSPAASVKPQQPQMSAIPAPETPTKRGAAPAAAKSDEAVKAREALVGTWQHRVWGTAFGRRFDQTLTITLCENGAINDPHSRDTWLRVGSVLHLKTRDNNGRLVLYVGKLSPDAQSYEGKLGSVSFRGTKVPEK
jgi:FlhB HrpN YscU SpaS Family